MIINVTIESIQETVTYHTKGTKIILFQKQQEMVDILPERGSLNSYNPVEECILIFLSAEVTYVCLISFFSIPWATCKTYQYLLRASFARTIDKELEMKM